MTTLKLPRSVLTEPDDLSTLNLIFAVIQGTVFFSVFYLCPVLVTRNNNFLFL
jgi:hypothetical protein